MRIAAIDIGTNSIHMVIADASGPEGFTVVDREREVVQIGQGSFGTGRLRAAAIRRTVDALRRQVQLARRHQVDRILCTATAAVREAKNGGDFLAAARAASGITPRVIPAPEEGRLIYLAVKSALALDDEPALIVDIGGGSVQLVVGNRTKLLQAVSAPLGALRLAETVLESDPPERRDLQRLRRLVKKRLRAPLAAVLEHQPVRVYGSSGSIHALANVAAALETGKTIEHINGHVLETAALVELTKKLEKMTVAQREKLTGIDLKRAEIIVPGAIVLAHILRAAGADGITLSDYGVREGLVNDYAAAHAHEISAIEKVADLRLRSVLQTLAKFQANATHARHVMRLALDLFDGLAPCHGFGADEREILRSAALLHDVGSVIGYDRHAEHSYYVIKNANLRGFTADDVEMVASVARYHSKPRPRKRDKSYRALGRDQRRLVRWLAAILRVAEGLDRSHYQLVRSVRVIRRKKRVTVRVQARGDAQLEVWAARRRTDVLAKLLRSKVRIAPERAAEGTRPAPRREAARERAEPGRVLDGARVLRMPTRGRTRG